jgi:methylthioribulose-1-phosphate dehydratase
MSYEEALHTLASLKEVLGARGWLRATSGNLSLRIGPDAVAITASGTDKQRVRPHDVLLVDLAGRKIDESPARPSAETGLHLAVYQRTDAGAVLHVHTVFNNSVGHHEDSLAIRDHEMLKALGHWNEDAEVSVPVLRNWADLQRLSQEAYDRIDPAVPGFLVRRHGVYAWGADADAALHHLEALEFLFEWIYYQELRSTVAREPGHVPGA